MHYFRPVHFVLLSYDSYNKLIISRKSMNCLVSVMEMQCVYCTFEWLILLIERSDFLLLWVHNSVCHVMWCHLFVLLIRMFGIRNLNIRLQSWIQEGHYNCLQILANKIRVLFKEIQVVCVFLRGVLMMLCSET